MYMTDSSYVTDVIKKIDDDKEVLVVGTTASLSIVDKIFYNVDKALESGIKTTMDFFSTTNIFIEDLVDYNTKTPNITILYNLKKDIKNIKESDMKFYTIANKKAPVLLGLDINLSKLLSILENNKDYVKTLEDSMLDFNKVLEDVINSKKDRISLDIDKDDLKALEEQVTTINKEISVITGKKLSDRKPVKSLVGNFNEYEDIVDKSLKLGEIYTMERLENIYDINEALVKKLDVIYNSIKNNETNMDKETFDNFILNINVIAKYVTVAAFLFYLYYQLLNMLISIQRIVEISTTGNGVIDSIALKISSISKRFRFYVKQLV